MNNQTLKSHEVNLLFALRSRSLGNVATKFGHQKECSPGCKTQDTQKHWMVCSNTEVTQGTQVAYNDIYGGL